VHCQQPQNQPPLSGRPAPAKPDAPRPKINHIVVDDHGPVFLNREVFTISALKEKLSRMKAVDPELGVVVEGLDDRDCQNVINVLDAL